MNYKDNELGISEHDMKDDVTIALSFKHWREQGICIFTYLDDEAGDEKTSVQSIKAASKRVRTLQPVVLSLPLTNAVRNHLK